MYFVKDAYMSLQNEHDALLAIDNKIAQEPQKIATNEVLSNTAEKNNVKAN